MVSHCVGFHWIACTIGFNNNIYQSCGGYVLLLVSGHFVGGGGGGFAVVCFNFSCLPLFY